MHTHAKLLELARNRVYPQVTFEKECGDLEGYAEPGMKARVLYAALIQHDVLKVTVDFGPFEAHNQPLESADYYDKTGVACLTAREAGYYKGVEDYYLTPNKGPEYFSIDSDERTALFEQFQASGSKGSYVSWLEDELLKHINT